MTLPHLLSVQWSSRRYEQTPYGCATAATLAAIRHAMRGDVRSVALVLDYFRPGVHKPLVFRRPPREN